MLVAAFMDGRKHTASRKPAQLVEFARRKCRPRICRHLNNSASAIRPLTVGQRVPWLSMYCLRISSVAPPTEQRKNPLLQTVRECLPQKKEPNLSSNAFADLLLSAPITSLSFTVGGYRSKKCTWSSSAPNSMISQSTVSAIERRVVLAKSHRSVVSMR